MHIYEITSLITCLSCLIVLVILIRSKDKYDSSQQNINHSFDSLKSSLHEHEKNLMMLLGEYQQKSISKVNEHIMQQMRDIREQLTHSFKNHAEGLSLHVGKLNDEVKSNLNAISGEVNKQLNTGFEQTTKTFTNVVKRLTIIDEAQKKIADLSSHVIDLQSIFQDKRSRGALGEVQLEQIVQNIFPRQHFALQYTLSNQKRADCILFLPPPTGHIAIDAKFPLENFQSIDIANTPDEKKKSQSLFKQDIKKHLLDISTKYIIPGETADGAIMFIPSESIFAEIHSNHPELVSLAHNKKVWLASPSTLMAILTTACSVIKEDATKKQVHIMQEHLYLLAKDFARFEKRMDNLSKHIMQANQDVSDIHTSAKKITSRFNKIENMEIPTDTSEANELDKLPADSNI